MTTTQLNINDKLPLTCSRAGTCCHGKSVFLNPWELVCFAKEKKITVREFRDLYCEFGGIRLRFDGKPGYKNQAACSQYTENFGCSVHLGRPLACRLYPLGRQIQNEKTQYIFQGSTFPCLEACPEVSELPKLTVGEYLEGQEADLFQKAQDQYLELMQNIADIAFALLLDTGLAASGNRKALALWKEMGNELPEKLAKRIGSKWIDALMLPEIKDDLNNPISFSEKHNELIQSKIQEEFGAAQTMSELQNASVLVMGLALHLSIAVGADPLEMVSHWIEIAKKNGAQ